MTAQNADPPPVCGLSGNGTGDIRKITWIGLAINVFLAGLKFATGIIGSSQAVVADAVHSLSDLGTDIAVLVGVKFWSASPDECHPYGHGRIETIITLGIGIALTIVGIGIAYKGIVSSRSDHILQPGWIAFAGAMTSIVLKEILYRWTISVGKRTRSSAVMANAWHHRSDAISSIPAALAVILALANPEWSFLDHIGALIVAMFIIHASWRIIKPAILELSDSGAPAQTRSLIHDAGMEIADVMTVHAIRTRRMGSGTIVDLHITVDGEMSVSRGHEVSEEVKRRIRERLPTILDVVVHLEPDEPEHSDED